MPSIAGAQLPPASPLLKIPERVETYNVFGVEGSWRISKTYPPYGPCPDHTPDPAHADAQLIAHATPTATAFRLIVIPNRWTFTATRVAQVVLPLTRHAICACRGQC